MQVLHDPDQRVFRLQDRPLLDMQFQVGMGDPRARRHVARVADAFELVAQPRAIGADGVQRVLQRKAARIHQRAHHVGLIAHALFIGEGPDRDRAAGPDACLAERARHGQSGEHAVAAVQRAGMGHGVDVRADHQRRFAACVGLGAQGAEEVADAVDADFEIELPHPSHDQVAAGLFVVGERDAGPAADVGGRADFAERAQLRQESGAIQLDVRMGHLGCLHESSPNGY